MQYAVVQNRLLSADEYMALDAHGERIEDRAFPDDELSLKLVYGSFKPQIEETPLQAMNQIRETILTECWYGTIREDRCLLSTFLDIEFYQPFCHGLAVDIPFAALLCTSFEIGNSRRRSVPFFVRYQDMSPATNILNRPGILCVYRQENRPKADVTKSGWRDAIRPERPLQCARNCI